nr:hypothetical protein CFP56_53586 [Quercus suber]
MQYMESQGGGPKEAPGWVHERLPLWLVGALEMRNFDTAVSECALVKKRDKSWTEEMAAGRISTNQETRENKFSRWWSGVDHVHNTDEHACRGNVNVSMLPSSSTLSQARDKVYGVLYGSQCRCGSRDAERCDRAFSGMPASLQSLPYSLTSPVPNDQSLSLSVSFSILVSS